MAVIPSNPQNVYPNEKKPVDGPWPWYVMLIAGVSLTGLFPWLMVCRAFFQRGKKATAFLWLLVNLTIYAAVSWAAFMVRFPWWWIVTSLYAINATWAALAWLVQRTTLGPARKRYHFRQWRLWIAPIFIGALIGFCLATLISIPTAFEDRVAMRNTIDSLDRASVLWSFFEFSLPGIVGGLFLGLWWAGEGRRFGISHVITFLSAFTVTALFWTSLVYLILFLIHKGSFSGTFPFSSVDWSLIPPWVKGFRRFIIDVQTYDVTLLLTVPLLFGAVSRFRDFGKRVLALPLLFVLVLPLTFSEDDWWQSVQGQLTFETSSPHIRTRALAHHWSETLIRRYPNHLQWPKIAEKLARNHYTHERYDQAAELYRQIIARYANVHKWYWTVERARVAVESTDFGRKEEGFQIQIPMVDYEEYLTHNWMTLLTLIRYWEGRESTESDVKIKLKAISRSSDKILLAPMDTLADLDDAARNLGYHVLLLTADLEKAKILINSEIPVIHHVYGSFNLLFGYENNRSMVYSYSFKKLSERLKTADKKEAEEILEMAPEGQGKSKMRLARIANEAYGEYTYPFWESPALKQIGPFMAIVVPEDKREAVAKALQTPLTVLQKESDGTLAAHIGLAFLRNADPVRAVEWARIAAQSTSGPLPLYVAGTAKLFWEARDKKIKSRIPLQDQFPQLSDIIDFFEKPENSDFLERGMIRLKQDLRNSTLPWLITRTCFKLLDQSDRVELELALECANSMVKANPAYAAYWKILAEAHEKSGNVPGMVNALENLVSAHPTDSNAKLHLAYGHVILDRTTETKAVLQKIDPDEIKYDADYAFCLGAVAEGEGEVGTALEHYARAIDMRRYTPIYHLKYGKLLLSEKRFEPARKALAWAAKIDADGKIRAEALQLLPETR